MYKGKLIPIIKYLGITYDEVLVDFEIDGEIVYNSIEWDRYKDNVYLHKFEGDLDFKYNINEIDIKIQRNIYLSLLHLI